MPVEVSEKILKVLLLLPAETLGMELYGSGELFCGNEVVPYEPYLRLAKVLEELQLARGLGEKGKPIA